MNATSQRTEKRTAPARRESVRMGRAVTLHVDWTACDGRGLCTELLPELLVRDEWGYPKARDGSREPVVPRGLRGAADDAVAACPLLALRLRGA